MDESVPHLRDTGSVQELCTIYRLKRIDLRRRVVCELRSPSVLLGIDILAAYPTTG